MDIMETIKVLSKEQDKLIKQGKEKGIPKNINAMLKLCSETPKEKLLQISSFNSHIYFQTRSSFIQNSKIVRIHATTLFMGNPKVFDFLMKNNPHYKKEVSKQTQMHKDNNDFYHPINIPSIEKKQHKLLKTYLETQTPVDYRLFSNVDDLSSMQALWKNAQINHFQILMTDSNGDLKMDSKLKHSFNSSYLALNCTEHKICETIFDFISFEITRKLSSTADFNQNIQKFAEQISLLKEFLGESQFFRQSVNNNEELLNFSKISSNEIINEALSKNPEIIHYLRASNLKQNIENRISQVDLPIEDNQDIPIIGRDFKL